MGCTATVWEFYAGESKSLEIQVFKENKTTGCKEPLEILVGDTLDLELPALPANLTLTKLTTPAIVLVNGPLGKIKVDLTATQTNAMTSGSTILYINKTTSAKIAVALSAIKKLTVPGC
jgi:hypothetical protein